MTLGASGDGEFISKYPEDITRTEKKRAIPDNADVISKERHVLLPVSMAKRSLTEKRDVTEASVARTENSTEVISC